MAYKINIVSNGTLPSENISQQITSRFPVPVECLAAHLLLECSEVMAGIKPASLVSLVNRTRPCGRNLYQLWQSHHEELSLYFADISFKLLQITERALLLFCYQPGQLEAHLAHPGIRVLLGRAGYDPDMSGEDLLAELCRRIENSATFPHEIGLFIGYPTKDVAAFMGLVRLPFSCQGPWKIYGNPDKSLQLANRFKACRSRMTELLSSQGAPLVPFHHIKRSLFI